MKIMWKKGKHTWKIEQETTPATKGTEFMMMMLDSGRIPVREDPDLIVQKMNQKIHYGLRKHVVFIGEANNADLEVNVDIAMTASMKIT